MNATRKLWISLAGLLLASFGVLLWLGGEIHRVMPPMPDKVATADGRTLYTRADIETGRQVWQSIGGMQLGSIWGHGATWRRTGARTGCIAKPSPGSTWAQSASTATPIERRSASSSAPRCRRG